MGYKNKPVPARFTSTMDLPPITNEDGGGKHIGRKTRYARLKEEIKELGIVGTARNPRKKGGFNRKGELLAEVTIGRGGTWDPNLAFSLVLDRALKKAASVQPVRRLSHLIGEVRNLSKTEEQVRSISALLAKRYRFVSRACANAYAIMRRRELSLEECAEVQREWLALSQDQKQRSAEEWAVAATKVSEYRAPKDEEDNDDGQESCL